VEKETKSGRIFDAHILKRLFEFVRPYKARFYTLVFLILLMALLTPLTPLLIRYTLDHYVALGDYSGLTMMLLVMVGLLVVQSFAQYFNTYLSGWLGQNIIRDIRIKLYEKILHLRLKFFDDTPIGRLVTRTVSDIETLADVFSEGIAAIAGDMLQLLLILAAMFYIDWRLTLISLATIPFLLLSTYIFKEKIKDAFNEVRVAVANLNSFVQEHITGMSIVQIFNSEKVEYEKFREINDEHRRSNMRSVLYYSVYYPVADVIGAAGVGLVVWYGARSMLQETTTLGTVTAFIMFLNMFFRPIRMIADRFNTLQMGIVSTDRILKLLDSTEYAVNDGTYQPDEMKGTVEFSHVWFAYNEENYVMY
jgi:ATP-binding cassette, subfamily B, multidrug efflux pump